MWKRSAVILAAFVLGLTVTSARAQAAPHPIPWSQLPQQVAGRLISLADLGVQDCPQDLASRTPGRRVLQYIENVFYSWEEYDLAPASGSTFCIVMRRPFNRPLSAAESQVLLTASSLWLEAARSHPEAGIPVPDELVRGRVPLPWHGDVDPVLTPDPAADRGFAGSPSRTTGGPAVHEGGPVLSPRGDRLIDPRDVIGGQDNRTVVSNTGAFPNRVISYVTFDTESQTGALQHGRATGFMVGPYMLLTNGHVVWNEERRELVTNLTITPGFNGANGFGTRDAVRLATNPGWVATAKIQYDYAAAFIDTPFDDITTFMPLAFDVAPANGSQVTVAGYPAKVRGADTAAQWTAADKVVSVQGRVLRYKVDTSPGNSGSPVWQALGGGQVRTIGIHSTGDPTNSGNSGVRLVAQNFDLISEWLSWTPQTSKGLHLTINQIDAESCPLVKAIVTVNDNSGQPVPDLTRANFTLDENGVPQAINVEQAQVSNSAISVALVLDASGSLSDSDVANIRDASRRFVDLLGPRDKVAVYHFANGVALVQDYTTDKARIKAAIDALNDNGGGVGDGGATALFDAVVEAAQHSGQTTGRRALVVMTDGLNNTGSQSESSAIAAANAASVPVFTIGFGDADAGVLGDIATATGGRFFLGGSSADLQAILAAIGRTFEQQYLVSWVTSFVSGGHQAVDVTVTDGFDSDEAFTSYSQTGAPGCAPPNASCVMHILQPNGGEVWTKGKTQTIKWTSSGPSCGATDGLAISDGTEIWYLADTAARSQTLNIDFLPPGTLYRAIVADRATGHFDTSDNTFSIASPSTGFTCVKGADTLCLLKGRYQVKVLWHPSDGSSGGFARAVAVGDTAGYFWFFDNTNPELALKLVDGRAVNAHVWFFSGALTSIEYSVFVTDVKTGETQVYSSVEGEFRSFADDTAFGPPPEGTTTTTAAAVDAAARTSDPQPPLSASPGVQARFPAPDKAQSVLWEQSDHPGSFVIGSAHRTDAPQFDAETADDFVVPAQKTWLLQGIDVAGGYYGSGAHGPADSLNVVVYADRNGLPGAAKCTFRQIRPRAGLATGVFEIDLASACRLVAGRYWIAVQTNQNAGATGVWGWLERTTQRERPSAWRNPGGGFNTACNDWGRRAATCKVGDEPDFIFRLRGQVETGGGGGGTCKASGTALCLSNKRIKAEVTWRNPKGQLVAARATALTGSTGYFSLDSNGLDLAVKIIDGRPVNGSFWLFYGGLSSVEYTIKISDPVTGIVKTYSKPKGLYTSGGDGSAIPSP